MNKTFFYVLAGLGAFLIWQWQKSIRTNGTLHASLKDEADKQAVGQQRSNNEQSLYPAIADPPQFPFSVTDVNPVWNPGSVRATANPLIFGFQ